MYSNALPTYLNVTRPGTLQKLMIVRKQLWPSVSHECTFCALVSGLPSLQHAAPLQHLTFSVKYAYVSVFRYEREGEYPAKETTVEAYEVVLARVQYFPPVSRTPDLFYPASHRCSTAHLP